MSIVLTFRRSQHLGLDPGTTRANGAGGAWPGVMARALGTSFEMIEEGLRGRTTDDPEELGRNGLAYFAPLPAHHAPLDLAVISLGCNDTNGLLLGHAGDDRRGR